MWKRSLLEFPKTFRRNNFSLSECLGRDVFLVQQIRSWPDWPGSMAPDWLTLSGKFVSIWSIKVAVWSVTLVCLVIICSKEYVKQNSKFYFKHPYPKSSSTSVLVSICLIMLGDWASISFWHSRTCFFGVFCIVCLCFFIPP